jgi:hypothetical protein
MIVQPHTVVISHGFGVKKDDPGVYAKLEAYLRARGAQTRLFDYNIVDRERQEIVMQSFAVQKDILLQEIAEARSSAPDGVIDLVCHSLGCVIAALAAPQGIRKTIFLAPPFNLNFERFIATYTDDPKTSVDPAGTSRLGRWDGYTVVVDHARAEEALSIDPGALYRALAAQTELTIFVADRDEHLPAPDESLLAGMAKFIHLDADHNFHDPARQELFSRISQILGIEAIG